MRDKVIDYVLILAVALSLGAGFDSHVRAERNHEFRQVDPPSESPAVDIPEVMRQKNWSDAYGNGSCVHASMVMLFRWQGLEEFAEYWRRSQSGGEYPSSIALKLEKHDVRFAHTTGGNVEFLEWCIRTRRGASVKFDNVRRGQRYGHMVCLVHLSESRAAILDNNSPDKIQWMPRDEFLSHWRASRGWAVTPVYEPPPRLPWSVSG